MAPRRGKKAVATQAVASAIEDIENAAEIVSNSKPTKAGAKKKKIEKDEQYVVSDKIVPVKIEAKTKNTTTTAKKAKYSEQIELAANDEHVSSVKIVEKPKKPTTKKDAKSTEQKNIVNTEPVNGSSEGEKKKSSRGKKKKEEESPKVISEAAPKVTAKATSKASKSKKAEPKPIKEIVEAVPGKADKKSTKSKTVKQPTTNDDVINETIETVAVTKRSKRGAEKALPKKTIQIVKPVKGKAEQLVVADDNVLDNKDVDSTKSRKRKAMKVVIDKAKDIVDSAVSVDVVDGSNESKAVKKRKADTNSDSTTNEKSDELVTKRKKSTKSEVKADSTKAKLNPTTTDLSQIDFESNKEFTLKIVSWNVAGLRSLIGKGGFEYFEYEKPDIICLQEIKCLEEEVPDAAKLKGYHPYWCSTPGGRGGVAILSKSMPYHVDNNIGDEEMDEEGRIITAEYSKFFLCCVYVPNAGRKLVNLDRRLRWNTLFENHVNKLKSKKPVIICGDMNVAHEEIDLTNPKTNRKNAGFSDEERAGMTNLLAQGFIDTFRELYPSQDKAYTFWSYMGNARQKNIGWRLDYSIVSENLKSKVVDSFIRSPIRGSDHCPIVLTLKF